MLGAVALHAAIDELGRFGWQAIADHVQSTAAAAGQSDLFFLVAATPEYQLA